MIYSASPAWHGGGGRKRGCSQPGPDCATLCRRDRQNVRKNAIDLSLPRPTTLSPEARRARDERTNAFLASEAFIPFVLDCFARAVEDAAIENAALAEQPRPAA